MTFEAALINELKTITALGNRIYPLTAPEANRNGGTPYVIIVSSEGLRTKSMDGYQTRKLVAGEINVISDDYDEMRAVTESVLNLLVTMERRVIGTTGPYIQEFTYEQPREFYEEQPDLYRCLIDFTVYF